MTRMSGKQALIEQLAIDGTRYVFGNPGTTEQGFMDALQDQNQLEFILALHEGVAVGMADAYARATRKPAFVELHIAPGLGNAMGMLYDAARGHSPLVVYAGQSDTHSLAQEPLLSGDLVRLAEPLCKWSVEASHAADVPRLLRRAMKVAADPPPGPVFLSLPIDVLDQTAEMQIAPTSYVRARSRPELAAVREAATLLAGARHPAIVVGDGVGQSGGQAEVGALADLLGAPIHVGYASEINMPADHALAAGPLNVVSGAAVRSALEGSDVILIAGTPVFRTIFPASGSPLPESVRVIQVDLDTWELAKNAPVDIAIAADPRETLAELIALIAALMTTEQLEQAHARADAYSQQRKQANERLRDHDQRQRDQMPIAVTRLMEEIAAALPANSAVFDESITSGAALQRYVQLGPGSYFRARGGGLGPGMPGTVGLQLAYPDRPVIGVVADGSAMYTITALWTAAHHNIPVTWVICNNSSYRILKLNLQEYLGEAGAERRFMHTDLIDPPLCYDKVAESMGVRGRRVERPEDLPDALREAIAHPGPSLVDVVIDPAVPWPRASVTESFSESLRAEAANVWQAIFDQPFLAELATSTLPLEKFRYYISQDFHYLEAFGRAVALALGRAPDSETVRLLAARVLTPIERPLHARLFELTGLVQAEVQSIEIAPTNRAYMNHLLATGGLRSIGETVAALLPCPWTYDEIGKRLADAEPITHPIYAAWAGFYTAGFLQESVRAWRELLDLAGLEAGPSQRIAMRDAFLLSSRYELRFWKMAHDMERWDS